MSPPTKESLVALAVLQTIARKMATLSPSEHEIFETLIAIRNRAIDDAKEAISRDVSDDRVLDALKVEAS
jgi:hypothetical protein